MALTVYETDNCGADGSRYQSIYEPTEPSQPVMSDDCKPHERAKPHRHISYNSSEH